MMVTGYPVVVPHTNIGSLVGFPSVSMIAKVMLTGDTTLGSDNYDLLLDAGDSETDIPCFVFPKGTMIEDIGLHTFQAWGASDMNIIFGDTADSDGWVGSDHLETSDTDAAGLVRWLGQNYTKAKAELESSVKLDSTANLPAYLAWGPKIVFGATDDSGDTGVWTTDIFEMGLSRWHVNLHYKDGVIASGGTEVYIKYNFAFFYKGAPSSDLGVRD